MKIIKNEFKSIFKSLYLSIVIVFFLKNIKKFSNETTPTLNPNENNKDKKEIEDLKRAYEKEIKQLEAVIIDLKNQIDLTKKTFKNKLQVSETNYKVSLSPNYYTLSFNECFFFLKELLFIT